jgi:hypothetical protein
VPSPRPAVVVLLVAAAACSRTRNLVSDDGGLSFADADPAAPDAGPNPGCEPGNGPECNNCEDDDDDGLVDGFDPECTGSLDDREDSFATGIHGDSGNAVKQDCFYDGDSGGGNDGCDLHVCCLLDGECPISSPPFDPEECAVTAECVANCMPITPPGCDCFGCCTICDDEGCADILTVPAVAPLCDAAVIHDQSKCPPCSKFAACSGGDCGGDTCILCPGQTEEDLPPPCGGHECPGGISPCFDTTDCLADEFCSAGCCITDVG